jgi:signal transduction histidine kinase
MNSFPARVLIVEDDQDVAAVIARFLEDGSYQACLAADGVEALERLRTTPCDLVILDRILPDTTGDQLCQAIKAQAEHTFLPVLMLTVRRTLVDRVTGLDAGADDYLPKPFHPDELLARIRALLRIRAAELERAAAHDALNRQHEALQQAYDQLQAAQAQLIYTSKLKALGELVAGVAHEINNPLAVILGNAELLDGLTNEADRSAVEQIINSGQRARRVVQSLIQFARQGAMRPGWHLLPDLVDRLLDLTGAGLRARGIALQVEYAPLLPPLYVDAQEMQRVLLSMLQNATYALTDRPDPQITLRAGMLTLPVGDPPVFPEVASYDFTGAGEAMVIDISDNGTGIDPAIADRLFEPFVTTKPGGVGVGLGLAIAYGIVKQHSGWILVSSKPNQGATFRIVLPKNG